MTRGILIAGNESALFFAAAAEAAKRVQSFASVMVPRRLPQSESFAVPASRPETEKAAIPLSWNPASPISARTLVVTAENRLEQINDAILICSPPALFKTAENLTPEEIEIFSGDQIKSWFFLVRELSLYFRRRGSGTLSLVAPEITGGMGNRGINALGKNAPADILGPCAAASFRAFASGVIASQADEPFLTMGFTAAEAGDEADFAAWFFKAIDSGMRKNSGRWHKYSGFKLFR